MAEYPATHNCASTIGGMTGLLTSLALCLESDAWSCKSHSKNVKYSAISLMFFLGVNGFQQFMRPGMVGPLNQVAALMPSLLFVGDEMFYCSQRATAMGMPGFSSTMNMAKILPTILLPILICQISSSSHIHDTVCGVLHKIQKVPKTSSSQYIENVKNKARDALHAAETSLDNGTYSAY
jgi:hypothetical protein